MSAPYKHDPAKHAAKAPAKLALGVAHFGTIRPEDAAPIDWANAHDPPDPDDEDLAQTPNDVIETLGFDPKDPA